MCAVSSRTAVVTGANSGLGYETALKLADSGAHVVMACRNQPKGDEAIEQASRSVPAANLSLAKLDLASLDSVRQFAEEFLASYPTLDILVNNAGVMALPERRATEDAFEMQFGTNHLGHFALTGRLLSALMKQPGARVVTVSSFAHRTGRIGFNDLQAESSYRKWTAYGQSKLANLLFAFELNRRTKEAGAQIVSVAAHPGFSATHLQDGTSFGPMRVFARPASQGAIPIFHAATAPGVQGGEFFGPGILPWARSQAIKAFPSSAARNLELARRLWEVSEELTGVRYEALAP